MTWDRGFDQREENGEWRPPRPLGSNVPVGDNSDSVWYEYRNGQTTQVQEPDSDLTTHFKTFSFYFDNGFWIYPCNAIRYQVGDGEIHPPPNDSDTDGEGDSGITDDGNTDEPEDDNRLEDWKPLEFDWDIDTGTSFATIRAEHAVLQTQRPDQAWLRQILPAWYFAPQAEHTTAAERGGLVGKIPILIALIAFSVQPHLVTDALMHCLGRSYNLHHQPPGLGCKFNCNIRVERS